MGSDATSQRQSSSDWPSTDQDSDLFPQPLTPFELYYMEEDRSDYPSVFPIRLECHGSLEKEAFEKAYRLAHARHPILSAQIERNGRRRPHWVAGEPTPIHWQENSNAQDLERTGLVPFRGLVIRVSQAGEKTVIDFSFHHTAVDGLGAFQFVKDLMLAYAHICSGDTHAPRLHRLEPERLRNRDAHQLLKRKLKLIDLIRFAQVCVPLVLRNSVVLSDKEAQHPPESADRAVPDYLVHHLTAEETNELSRVAGALSVMLHDLMVRDLFMTLDRWNLERGEARRRIRILVPTNMRRREDHRMPAANVFSFAFLTRRSTRQADRRKLLESIRQEMSLIKRQKRGLYYETGLRLFCLCPPLMRWVLNRPRSFATAVFSNLGTGFDRVPLPLRHGRRVAGELIVETGFGAAPIRPETRVSIAVHTYAGRMSVCLRCDPKWFDIEQQRTLLDAYVDQLRLTLQANS